MENNSQSKRECCEKCGGLKWKCENCPCHKSVEGESWGERLDRIWSRAHIPDFATDAKFTIKALITDLLAKERESERARIKAFWDTNSSAEFEKFIRNTNNL